MPIIPENAPKVKVWRNGYAREAASLREASATSIGAVDDRLFRLRKTAMLSRHWRLWLSFPPSRSLPKRQGMGRFWGRGRFSERSASPPDPLSRRAAGVWRDMLLRSWFRLMGWCALRWNCERPRRLTEPPRTCGVAALGLWLAASSSAEVKARPQARRQVAAALSAAVTITPLQRTAPNSQGHPA